MPVDSPTVAKADTASNRPRDLKASEAEQVNVPHNNAIASIATVVPAAELLRKAG